MRAAAHPDPDDDAEHHDQHGRRSGSRPGWSSRPTTGPVAMMRPRQTAVQAIAGLPPTDAGDRGQGGAVSHHGESVQQGLQRVEQAVW